MVPTNYQRLLNKAKRIGYIPLTPDEKIFSGVSQEDQRRVINQKLSDDPIRWVEQTRILKGLPFSFRDRNYLHQIYRDPAKTILISKGRQTEISELLVNLLLFYGWKYPNSTLIYCADRMAHTYKFSNRRIQKNALHDSLIMQKIITSASNHTTTQLPFENGSVAYFISAWDDFEEVRSIPADFVFLDEVQSVNLQEKDVLMSSMDHSEYGRLWGVGTGSLYGSDWQKWHSSGTNYTWNDTNESWVAKDSNSIIHSYNIPQTIVPWITPDDIEQKRGTMNSSRFTMEIMGGWAQGVEIPITEHMVNRCFSRDVSITPPEMVNRQNGPIGVSFDWGGGTKSHTIAGAYQVTNNGSNIQVLNIIRILDSDLEVQSQKAISFVNDYDPDFLTCDEGGGTHQIQRLEKEFGSRVKRVHYIQSPGSPWKLDQYYSHNLIKVDRTFSLDMIFEIIRNGSGSGTMEGTTVLSYQIPKVDELVWLINDYTSMYGTEFTTTFGQQVLRYIKSKDKRNDALMCLNYFNIGYEVYKKYNNTDVTDVVISDFI